jgi:hypothetical protein
MSTNNVNIKINKPRGYKFLREEPNRTYLDTLEIAIDHHLEHLNEHSIVIKDRSDMLYYLYPDYRQFAHFYPENKLHCVDEVIFNWRIQRPKYDLDDYTEEQYVIILNTINNYYIKTLGYIPDIVKCDSSGHSKEKGRHKNSCHLIITNLAFANNIEADTISKEIYNLLPENVKKPYDISVNKSVQNFRTPFSTKEGRKKVCPSGADRQQCMITTVPKDIQIINIKRAIGRKRYKKLSNNKEIIVTDKEVQEVLNLAAKHTIGWNFRKNIGSYYIFNRTPSAPKYCECCKHGHDRDHTLRLIATRQYILLSCIRTTEKIIIHKYLTNLENILNNAKSAQHEHEDIPKICNFNLCDIYNSKYMNTLQQHKTIYLKAGMKLGKTQSAIEYMKNFRTIVVVSFRRTFTAEKIKAFQTAGIYFKSYLDIDSHKINLGCYKKVVIQVESLHRLLPFYAPDLVLLDESESIFEQFSSDTMKDPQGCYALFEWLLKGAKNVLAMDANMSVRTIDVLRHIRGTDDEIFIHNKHKNLSGEKINIVNKDILLAKILELINNDNNIAIPTNSKKFADAVYEMLKKNNIAADDIQKITSETPARTKEKIFSNINNEWKKYRAVIYTPSCSAGISFTEEHFDYVCGFFSNRSTSVETARQMLYRVRNVRSKEYYVTLDASVNNVEFKTLAEVDDYLQTINFMVNCKNLAPLKYEVTDNGYIFERNGMYKIYTHNYFSANKSKCKFIEEFVKQSLLVGAELDIAGMDDHEIARNAIAEYNKARLKVVLAQKLAVMNAMDLDQNQFEDLCRANRTIGITAEDSLAMQKYMLRRTYNWDCQLDEKFMDTYYDDNVIDKYKNLKCILSDKDTPAVIERLRQNNEKNLYDHNKIHKKYTKHKIATDLIAVCGYKGPHDESIISRENLEKNLNNNKEALTKSYGIISQVFPATNIPTQWKFRNIMIYINTILYDVYGLKINAKSNAHTERNNYIINHHYYGAKFSRIKNNEKPYIEFDWINKDKIVEIIE